MEVHLFISNESICHCSQTAPQAWFTVRLCSNRRFKVAWHISQKHVRVHISDKSIISRVLKFTKSCKVFEVLLSLQTHRCTGPTGLSAYYFVSSNILTISQHILNPKKQSAVFGLNHRNIHYCTDECCYPVYIEFLFKDALKVVKTISLESYLFFIMLF